ncbi:error-prone DNA polymerase [Agrococcus sp. ARC_14]|uniref:error-prone DNA polymerase n=1 Tax=Agrococcus sp. ARC_14 TaxID=2919927 RepID=UPI001F06B6B4|nr:error-prone DNA polymerase [Agrococcus sp. ARC_14]MCH1884424.1 error-prone DNA polymerase [Agrococcus sp. ARC_14]
MAGWNNPAMPWRELEGILSDRDVGAGKTAGHATELDEARRQRIRVPAPEQATPYAELHAHSHYSFLDGASSPAELVNEARRLGLEALALVDHDGLYGAVRFAEAAAEAQLPTVFGTEFTLGLETPQNGIPDPDGSHLIALATGPAGYSALASALTDGYLTSDIHGPGEKGRPIFELDRLAEAAHGEWLILSGCRKGTVRQALDRFGANADGADAAGHELDRLTSLFGRDRVAVELSDIGDPRDFERNRVLAELAEQRRLPVIATTNAHIANPARQQLGDAVAAVRARRSIDELDAWLPAGGVPSLRSGAVMARRFRAFPGAIDTAAALGRELAFDLRAASPQLPKTEVPQGHTPMSWLRVLVAERLPRVYDTVLDPAGAARPSAEVQARIDHELHLIDEKGFAGYFLIVFEIAEFAHGRGILCQGRGSAVASAVCFILGITAVDPIRYRLPFERFISMMREEEPDIDIDFDADRREEVIQHVYERYGRRNAAQVANVITYRPKSAVRDAAKALGYAVGQQNAWSKSVESYSKPETDGIPEPVALLAGEFLHAPRHLGIHSGGMVLTEQPVGTVCPIEPARMKDRTVLQWDKDDCEWMGLVKFDLLGLGMLSAMSHTMALATEHTGEEWTLATIPLEEPGVYDMLCEGDAVGVFQVESRAQLATLPRLKPRSFYDLVIEIALIRPGPIQGDAVHPYLRRRSGQEPITYAHPLLEPVLERTLGIPLFQEQLMQMSVAVGGFDAGEADQLRRAIGSKRSKEKIAALKAKLFVGMAANGIEPEMAEAIYRKIEAFAGFGFAESHSLAFAKLVYASSWLKLHYPAAFLAGLLRSQPMGFWSAQTLVADATRHGVETLRPDVVRSGVDAGLEARPSTGQAVGRGAETAGGPAGRLTDRAEWPAGDDACMAHEQPAVPARATETLAMRERHRRDAGLAVRMGLAGVSGIGSAAAERIVAARGAQPLRDIHDLARRADLDRGELEALATAGALDGLGVSRREGLWLAGPAATEREDQLEGTQVSLQPPLLPMLSAEEQVALDIWSTGVATDDHPVRHARAMLDARGVLPIAALAEAEPGRRVHSAGVVTHRQRPRTAQGVTFMNLEDETGMLNVIVSKGLWLNQKQVARHAPALIVRGMLQRTEEGVIALLADRLERFEVPSRGSRDFQ